MRIIALATAAILIATQGAALSCLRPDPVTTFERLNDDSSSYYLLLGTLDFNASLLPKGVVNEERTPAPIAANFKGFGLTKRGFTTPFERPVTLQPVCFGPWCGNEVPGIKSLFFAKVAGDDVVINSDPCGGTSFPNPSRQTLDAMTACMNGNCP